MNRCPSNGDGVALGLEPPSASDGLHCYLLSRSWSVVCYPPHRCRRIRKEGIVLSLIPSLLQKEEAVDHCRKLRIVRTPANALFTPKCVQYLRRIELRKFLR